MFARHARKMGASPYIGDAPMPVGGCLLAPHSSDALEDDTAHERDAHAKASKGERGVHAKLDAARIQRHGEDGEDRTDCETSNARTIESSLGVDILKHCRSPFSCSSLDTKYIKGYPPLCIYELTSSQILHACVGNMNCPLPSSLLPACLNIGLVERKNEQERIFDND